MSYATYPQPTSGFMDSLLGGIKTIGKGALDYNNAQQQAAGAAAANAQAAQAAAASQMSAMPSWLLPVAVVGGLGIGAYLILGGKKKSAAVSNPSGAIRAFVANPARRRRRRRARR